MDLDEILALMAALIYAAIIAEDRAAKITRSADARMAQAVKEAEQLWVAILHRKRSP